MIRLILLLQFIFFLIPLFAQTNLSGVINQYTAVSEIDYCNSQIDVADATAFQVGMNVLLIQMQGATIEEGNNSDFGSVTNIGNAGKYEKAEIAMISGNSIFLTNELTNDYDMNGKAQLVTFPKYDNILIDADLTAAPWNGTTGGVLAIEAIDTISLNANIDVSGTGFRGGTAVSNTPNNCQWFINNDDYFDDLGSWRSSAKGEGIAAFITDKEAGRGPQANGGGGGNDHNSGGGGGANTVAGGLGGFNDEPATFGCNGDFPGLGGIGMVEESDRIFMGGGGGAGHGNNGVGTDGGNGGGIVFLEAKYVAGNSFKVSSNGIAAEPGELDGPGGGGAAGTLVMAVSEGYISFTTLEADGGDGGDQDNIDEPRCMGTGGGGSGGRIIIIDVTGQQQYTFETNGGQPGVSENSASCANSTNGAQIGQIGTLGLIDSLVENKVPLISPQIIVQAIGDTICEGQNTSFEIFATGSNLIYQWQVNDGSGFVNVIDDANYNGSATNLLNVNNSLIDFDGSIYRCVVTTDCFMEMISNEVALQVDALPIAGFDFTTNGAIVNFTDMSSGANTYAWFFGDNTESNEASPNHTYSMSGDYVVSLMVTNDCGSDIYTLTVSVNAVSLPMASFTANVISGCAPLEVQFTDTSVDGIESWDWLFFGGTPMTSTEQNPLVIYEDAGIYNVVLAVDNAAGNNSLTEVEFIEVLAVPISALDYEVNQGVVTFTNLSTEADSFAWDFGDNSAIDNATNPIHTYTEDGNYEVTLTAYNDFCESSIIVAIPITIVNTENLIVENNFKLYPNPTTGTLILDLNETQLQNAELQIHHADGRLLWSQNYEGLNQLTLDVSFLAAGVYTFTIKNAGVVYTKLLVKE